MGLGEAIKQGIIGFALYAGNWLLPANDEASVSVIDISYKTESAVQVTVKMAMALNPELEELIDAGIPLKMRFITVTDNNDTAVLFRTLCCNVADLKYRFTDSAGTGIVRSREYPMILLAMKDFCEWKFIVPRGAGECRTEIEMLNSHVSQLNRTVDMSRIWGQKRIKTACTLARKGGTRD